ncbi:MAG TPA: curli production assembly protein CsgB, partial [Pseudomonas sp.]|nr:curli production assembly protein CsgB [Pseudomonas sp.]
MARYALPRATSLSALVACLACAPLMAADLMDNGDLSPLGTNTTTSQLAVQLTDAKAAYIQQLGQGNLAELTQNGQALSAQMLQQGG